MFIPATMSIWGPPFTSSDFACKVPICRVTGDVVLGRFHLDGFGVNQDLEHVWFSVPGPLEKVRKKSCGSCHHLD